MIVPSLVAAGVLFISYLYRKLHYKRFRQYANFPQHPSSLLLGHLQVFDEFMKKLPPKAHADMAFAAMHEALGRPPVMLVDLRPVASPMVVVSNYEVAEQIVRTSDRFPYSPPKVPEIWKQLEHLAGPKSIISADGEEWKALRKHFNPGFAPSHLVKLLPSILDKAFLFLDHLDTYASTGEEFLLQRRATDLTFDIIGHVALDFDMDAQTAHPTEFMRRFSALILTYTTEHLDLPWWCTPWTELKRHWLTTWIRKTLREMIQQRYSEGRRGAGSRSILSMSLKDIDTLTPEIVDVTVDQLTSFLFAGHDTTSTLISYAFYELSRTPHALRAVRAELDQLFGPDSDPTAVRSGEELVHRMSYTMAVIKETLRLWPPGAASRMTKSGTGFTVTTPSTAGGGEFCLDGLLVYNVHSIIQRDPSVFGETANQFLPERWLNDTSKIPVGAWRGFERGPRNCIGQELATLEVRVLIALVARRYDFTKVGIGAPALDDDGKSEIGSNGQKKAVLGMYMTRKVTSKPVDGMKMKVKLA
ncbi:cytochrome P450 [Apodospora peruviana]|uniref:Cytochrome P450 n=1 Tax=Apodospora peruviana TaxID=516989 RepID=A0AAE0I1S5_9PEZI|nr:cytochrome P450 [Apodospora peruviana]